ncbi:MAG: NAD(P)H-hydrate epimerase, partial [Gemmatimonadaceae bacterium]
MTTLRVVTAAQSAARDRAAIEAGVPSRALMRQAGAAAATEIARRRPLDGGVAIFAGPGNNGGDAWVVARSLAAAGVAVRVCEAAEARTPD